MGQDRWLPVLRIISDGVSHSAAELAATLAIPIADINLQIETLRGLGLKVLGNPNKGFRLPYPVDLFDAAELVASLPEWCHERIVSCEVAGEVDSSNTRLLEQTPPEDGQVRVFLAEYQSAGRGRRGRNWLSPPASGICLSLAVAFDGSPHNLAALPLALGVATRRALTKLGIEPVGIKWPNDLVAKGKLAGILVELRNTADNRLHLVAGLGLNYRLPGPRGEAMAGEWRDVAGMGNGAPPSRSSLVQQILPEWVAALDIFMLQGLKPFLKELRRADVCRDQQVDLVSDTGITHGVCRGIADDGCLLLEAEGEIQRIVAGDISLRPTRAEGWPRRGLIA
ncbi:MAG: biotin--[acetyl-CoA-carboxylase] ligase [Proteobacteria bacterium]|nr:biotin--[acetyl-CoA-carboxylase] ligase [Pseudomonadota bacterium]